jgi:hypothetical protein
LGYPVVDIDLNQAEKINFDEWFDSIQFIPLESTKNSMIAYTGNVLKYDNKYFIREQGGAGSFLVFDSIGNFLFNSLSIKGPGPKEYLGMYGFGIDINTGNITIYDFYSKILKVYDSKFNFLKDISVPLHGGGYYKITDDIYLSYNYLPGQKELIDVFSVKKGEIIKKLYPLVEEEAKKLIVTESVFRSVKGCFYFTPPYPNTELYRFDTLNLDLVKDLEYTIGGKEFSLDKLAAGKDESYYNGLLLFPKGPDGKWNDNYALVMKKLIVGDCYYALIHYKDIMYINRFDKKTGKQKTIFNQFDDGGLALPLHKHIFVDNDNVIYYLALPEEIIELVGEKHIDSKHKEMLNKAIEEDDNFWIVKYYMKK